jgi:hypothetical protein
MKRGMVRESPLIDEVELFLCATNLLKDGLTSKTLDDITSTHGTDQATAVLYQYLSSTHETDIAQINAYPEVIVAPHRPTKIIIIPGMFYKEHSDIGGDGALIKTIAEKFGFETERIDVLSRGSVLDNKEIIKKKLLENQHKNVWLVSLSKGSTEARLALEDMSGTDSVKNITGWINIGGLLNGTLHADKKLHSLFSKIIWYLTLQVLRIDYAVTEEIAYKNKTLQNTMNIDSHVHMIHIVGFPLRSHVEPFLRSKYKTLATIGPNDGIILLKDLLYISGTVYPVWGVDHFLRTSEMSGIIYKVCHYINNSK